MRVRGQTLSPRYILPLIQLSRFSTKKKHLILHHHRLSTRVTWLTWPLSIVAAFWLIPPPQENYFPISSSDTCPSISIKLHVSFSELTRDFLPGDVIISYIKSLSCTPILLPVNIGTKSLPEISTTFRSPRQTASTFCQLIAYMSAVTVTPLTLSSTRWF